MQRLQILSQGKKKSHSWHLWLYAELNNTAHFSPLTNLVNKTTILSSWDEPHSGAFRAKLLNKTTRVFHPQPNWWVTPQCAAFITSTLRVDIWGAHTYTYMHTHSWFSTTLIILTRRQTPLSLSPYIHFLFFCFTRTLKITLHVP